MLKVIFNKGSNTGLNGKRLKRAMKFDLWGTGGDCAA
jgi:hypothetical protein